MRLQPFLPCLPGRYTKQDFVELTAYAKARGVRVYLELDVPSHTGDKLTESWCGIHPEACPSPRCPSHNALDPRPASGTYEIIDDILSELASCTLACDA